MSGRSGALGRSADARPLVGLSVRTIGAHPAGWRMAGAHRNPYDDGRALARIAREAERVHLDFLYLGDWLSVNPELELTDPYLLSRIDPLTAASSLSAITRRIALIATVNTNSSDPATVARAAASIDILSGGRFGLNLAVGSDGAGSTTIHNAAGADDRYEVALEYVEVLRQLWDSRAEDAFVADASTGMLLDRSRTAIVRHRGRHFAVDGPPPIARPVQGHVPLAHLGASHRSRRLAGAVADLHFLAVSDLDEARSAAAELRAEAQAAGREPGAVAAVTSLSPIIGETTADAWAVYDRLVELLPTADDAPRADGVTLPPQRSAASVKKTVGVPLLDRRLDDEVAPADAGRFNATGEGLLRIVRSRSGRVPGTARPVTYRHLLAAQLVPSPLIVGSADEIADHVELWFREGAADGFSVLSAQVHDQVEAFTRLVVPRLIERGLFSPDGRRRTLRERLGVPSPRWTADEGQERRRA